MTVGEVAQMITAVAAVGGVFASLRNGRKIDVVHQTTNSLAKRNEVIARELGIAEGKAEERDKVWII
jgi:hypothetical protein